MAKRQIILFIQLSFFLNACSGQGQNNTDLTNSVWEKKGEFCSDSLHFYSNGKYQEYYCEFEQHMKGDFQIKGDTLTLVEYQLSSEVIADNPKLVPRYMVKYLLQEDNVLQKVYYKDIVTNYEEVGLEETWKYSKVK